MDIRITQQVKQLIHGKRGVTPNTAWLLEDALETTMQLWMSLQTNHDLMLNRLACEIEQSGLNLAQCATNTTTRIV